MSLACQFLFYFLVDIFGGELLSVTDVRGYVVLTCSFRRGKRGDSNKTDEVLSKKGGSGLIIYNHLRGREEMVDKEMMGLKHIWPFINPFHVII